MQGTSVRSLGGEDALEEGMATHSRILAWRIPRTEEPGGLQSTGSQRVGHDRATDPFFCSVFFFFSVGPCGGLRDLRFPPPGIASRQRTGGVLTTGLHVFPHGAFDSSTSCELGGSLDQWALEVLCPAGHFH